jgi:hypothetical protein
MAFWESGIASEFEKARRSIVFDAALAGVFMAMAIGLAVGYHIGSETQNRQDDSQKVLVPCKAPLAHP